MSLVREGLVFTDRDISSEISKKKNIILIKKCVYTSEKNENFWNQIEASVEIAL